MPFESPQQNQQEDKEKLSKKISGWVRLRRSVLAGMFTLNAFGAFAGSNPEQPGGNPDALPDIPKEVITPDVSYRDISKDMFLSPEDFKESRLDTLQFVNYFEVDKAEVSPENEKAIALEFRNFLDKVDESNIDQLLDNDFIVFASCDERESRYKGSEASAHLPIGNEQLAHDRASVTIEILENVFDTYDFADRISKSDAETLRNKAFTTVTPEGGVLKVENKEKLTPKELEDAYAKNRQVNFILGIESDLVKEKKIELSGEFESLEDQGIAELFAQYDKILFAADVSPSMKKNYDRMMAGFKASYKESGVDIISERTFSVIPYSNEIHREHATLVSSQGALEDILMKLTSLRIGSNQEAPLQVAQEIIDRNTPTPNEEKLLSLMFDEGLPNVSRADLEKLLATSTEKNIDIALFMIRQSDGHVSIMTPEKILALIDLNEKKQAAQGTYNIDVNETKVGDNGRTVSPDILVQAPRVGTSS